MSARPCLPARASLSWGLIALALAAAPALAAPPVAAPPLATPSLAAQSLAPQPLAAQPLAASAAGSLAEPFVVTDGGTLRRLPSIGRATKLAGETDRLVWPIWVTAAEAAAQPRLRLSWVAAVSVMPEASNLTVWVDDRPISSFHIASGGTPRSVDLALPAGTLKPGWNSIRIEAEQRHRVECTTASTYELWTEIDRNRSGLVFPGTYSPDRRGLPDIAGIAPDEAGRVRIRLVSPQDLDPPRLARALRVVQALTIAGGFLDPIVTVTRAPEKAPGIDLLFGAQARALHDTRMTGGPALVTLWDDPDPARLVVAVADDAATSDRVVDELLAAAGPRAEGTDSGLLARAGLGGLPVEDGARVRLSDLGATTAEFSGRLYRTTADLRLPPDFYAADYAKVQLRLAGGHAGGLERASRLTVRVNGRQAAGAPLAARQGELFTDRTLQIPLSAFRPGHNRIEIEASLVHPDDKVCDPALQIEGPKRFLLMDRTEIVFPTLARVARLPDLAATAAGVLGDLSGADRPTIWVPHPDPVTLSALATLIDRIAAASSRVDVPSIVFRNPPADVPSALVVGAFVDLPATVATAVGIEPVAIRDAWSRRAQPQQAAAEPVGSTDRVLRRASTLRVAGLADTTDPIVTGTLQTRPLTTGSLPTRALAVPRPDGEMVDRWRKSVESPWSPGAFLRSASGRVEQMFGSLLGQGVVRDTFVPRPSTGLVVAQALSPAGGVWTLVTAPNAGALADGVALLVESERWNELAGTVAAWDQVDEKVATTASIGQAFFTTRPVDPFNLRLVAAAWVSDNPIGFILAVLLATGLLGFATARLIPHLGVKS